MTEFVLEILDGDRVGEIFELSADPLTFGRRDGNTIVLHDEKCSGRHATIVQEGGQWVLRDLDSTNGTLLDGRRVDEVGLTANDIFQVGITRIAFKEKGAPTPRSDLSVKKVDSATLARSKRGGGIGALLILVIALLAAAGWWFFLRGSDHAVGGGMHNRVRSPRTVVGNQLTGGDLEAEGGGVFTRVAGIGFEPDFGAAGANSGTRYLLAAHGEDATAAYALARSGKLRVSSGSGAKIRAFVMTTGGATAAVRARFTSSNAEQPQTMFTGTVPQPYAEYTEVALDLPVPEGCDRVEVELLGFLPGTDATVSVDDVSMVGGGAGGTNKIQTPVGQRVTWTGTAMQIDDGQNSALLGVRPATTDATFAALADQGLLCLSDRGIGLAVAADAGSVVVNTSGGSGSALEFLFEPGIAASGVLAREGDAPFANLGQTFAAKSADSLLFGYKTERFMIRLPKPSAVAGAVVGRAFVVTLPDSGELRLVYDFRRERTAARGMLRAAEKLFVEGKFERVLNTLGRLLAFSPHDDVVAAKAAALRAKVRNQLTDAIRHLESELDEAVYFDSLRGYRRIQGQLASLAAAYGREHYLQPKKVAAMEAKVAAKITEIETAMGLESRSKLEVLAGIYGKSDERIGGLIKSYIDKFLPKKSGPQPDKPADNSAEKSAAKPPTKTTDKEGE